MAVGFVVNVGNTFQPLVLDVIGDRFDEFLFVDLIRKFGYDDTFSRAVVEIFDLAFCAENDISPSGTIGVADAASAHDDAARREIGCGNVSDQFVDRDVRIVDQSDRTVDHLA